MSYKKRNILILACFLLVIAGFGTYLVGFSYPAEIEAAEKKYAKLEKQVEYLNSIEMEFPQLLQQVEEKRDRLANIDKRVSNKVTSSGVHAYLAQIQSYTGKVDFHLFHNGNETLKDFGYKKYRLKGEGPFSRVFNFIWYLERGPEIFRLVNVSLKGVEDKDEETEKPKLVIPFEMEIWAYYAKSTEDLPKVRRRINDVRTIKARNAFYPYIKRNLPPNDEGLLEVERAELKALVADRALVKDHTGTIHVLRLGDKVYLGNLTRINPQGNQVEFTLNKGGAYEKIVLDLQFDESEQTENRE